MIKATAIKLDLMLKLVSRTEVIYTPSVDIIVNVFVGIQIEITILRPQNLQLKGKYSFLSRQQRTR